MNRIFPLLTIRTFFYKTLNIVVTVSLLLGGTIVYGQQPELFKVPPPADRVITYWQWMNGNITRQGITKDLEAMKTAGVNGTLLFSTGNSVAGPVKFMSNEWWDAMAHTIKESNRLGMIFGIYNSDGWSMSGGPWIRPEESMKQVVWADTLISGGRSVRLQLPRPAFNHIYHDIAVLAYPAINHDEPIRFKEIVSQTLVTGAEAASDHNAKTLVNFEKAAGGRSAQLVFDFGAITELRRVVFENINAQPFLNASVELEHSADGKKFIKIPYQSPLSLKAESFLDQVTFSFPKIEARYVRLNVHFESETTRPVVITLDKVGIGEISFYASPRIHLWEPKSGESKRIRHENQLVFMEELNSVVKDSLPAGYAVDSHQMIDLSKAVDSEGRLTWAAPAGRWVIQRIGYTSTNRMVSPATREGRGLECNKMDSQAVEKHFNNYVKKINDLSRELVGKPLDYMQMESWEAGIQNWNAGLEQEFMKRNRYSLVPYLPVLAGGYVVNSYEESNKFLWDFRNLIADMIAENYWGTIRRLANANGITVSGEGSGMQHYLYDPALYMKHLDIPMGEFWPNEGHVRADIKNSSSVAHTEGHNMAGAEAFTSGDADLWRVTPFDLKQIGDESFTMGTNHFVLHSYVHQPYDVAPGFTLAKFGNHLQRLNPWFTHAQGWFDYLARCQYMLRLGKPIQDVAYFTGEGIPGYLGLPWELSPRLPQGFDYDGVDLQTIRQMTVHNGIIHLPSGAAYRLLVFQHMKKMTPMLASEIKRLVDAGAVIYSPRPEDSPSLSNQIRDDHDVNDIVSQVWGDCDGEKARVNAYGKGRVYCGGDLDKILNDLKVLPDLKFQSDQQAQINFTHRRSADADIFFLANYKKENARVTGVFRVSRRLPELWNPDTGTAESLPYTVLNDQQIKVELTFEPLGSRFIVFRDEPTPGISVLPSFGKVADYPVKGPWQVVFKSAGDSLKTVFTDLHDWSADQNDAIRYFSGTADYKTDFRIKRSKDRRVTLALGDVTNDMATVLVNGKVAANLWKPPYEVDITSLVRKGSNTLEVRVTNTAVNSLIGDDRFPEDVDYNKNALVQTVPAWLKDPSIRNSKKKTFVTYKYLTKDSTPDPSGLLGPVHIAVRKKKK